MHDEQLLRAIANLENRIPRLTKAAADAREAYQEATLAAAGADGQAERRTARFANEALLARTIKCDAELAAESAALATARQRYVDAVAVRDAAELAARIEAEKAACADAAQKVRDAAREFDDALSTLAASRGHLATTISALFALIPASLKPDCAPVLGKGAIDGRALQALVDHGVLPGRHTNDDVTAPKVRMLALFDRCPALASLLPEPPDETECAA